MGPMVRAAVAGLPVYRPGRPAPLGPGGVSYKLSSNENPFPPLPGVIEAAEIACAQLNRYPDMGNVAMTEALSAKLAVAEDRLAFGTGSVAVLYHLLQAFCERGDEVVYAWRSFEAYPIAVQLTGATPVPVPLGPGWTHDLDALRAAVTPATKAVLLCTPNNPTGPALRHDDVLAFVAAVPDRVLVVIDEAYAEFVTDPAAVRPMEITAGHDNVVLLRTFSKAYGLAGLRVGFCVAAAPIARAVRAAALPFGVSVPAQAAVIASLAAEEALFERVGQIVAERERMVAGLSSAGFDIPAAEGNFVWLAAGPRTQSYADTFAAAGVMVRPYVSGDRWDGLRITVGEPEANDLVLLTAADLER
ncbi:histidinol-phosphate transaminase [Microlunatus panaciterrae]|uniref:Aromatic amino acid aminotransferase n=1 Tax=Microlunatus panaciterrae TaxID=400768 RepID=A0ABS2RJN7_9ACTN|nr:histidinol-phosphate transaminase [Microlunatus panaciterrae]MBM7798406.1 histidinol-phosphate aminotransferase [Microlunatus panaciterrae]